MTSDLQVLRLIEGLWGDLVIAKDNDKCITTIVVLGGKEAGGFRDEVGYRWIRSCCARGWFSRSFDQNLLRVTAMSARTPTMKFRSDGG